ncbi:MAG: HTTM domain-containing protein [Gammaproteobacteria bacterium]|nr:HTTM domain-containing protein [Gammaproteobacteria bacterium]
MSLLVVEFETALRWTEILLGFAFAQQSLEHLTRFSIERLIFFPRLVLSLLLIFGWQTPWVLLALFVLALVMLKCFQGPYNGGADRMGLLILCCCCLVQLAPTQAWKEIAIGYLSLQLTLSYFISGWVKVVNHEWRSGQALCDVFQFSTYPVSENLRLLHLSPRLLFFASWFAMGLELLFPLALFSQIGLLIALTITAVFHFSNACFFGLNRFFWIWISAYPSLLWFQQRVFVEF